jgi:hypothetical protein
MRAASIAAGHEATPAAGGSRVFRQVITGLLNFRFERLAANGFTQPARMCEWNAAFRRFDGDVFLHHQLGFLFPKS